MARRVSYRFDFNDATAWVQIKRLRDKNALDPLAEAIARDAGRYAPKRTGRLAASYRWEESGDGVRRVGSDVEYQPYVELGTEPHLIRPRARAGALWWPTIRTAGSHPVPKVNHPGATAHPHLRPALYQRRSVRGRSFS